MRVEIRGRRQQRLAAGLATRPGLQRLEIAPQGAHLIDGAVQRVDILCRACHQIPVRGRVGRGHGVLQSRVEHHLQRHGLHRAAGREAHQVGARSDDRSARTFVGVERPGNLARILDAQIPGEAVHSSAIRQQVRGRLAIRPFGRLRELLLLMVRERAQHLALGVEDLERDLLIGRRPALEKIVDHGAARRVIADRPAAVHLEGEMQVVGALRLIQAHLGHLRRGVDLAQGRQVIEHPERAAVGRDHEVVVLHDEIVHRRDGQIQLQRLPVSTVVEGHINPEFRARIQQSLFLRILAHRTHVGAFGYPADDAGPGLAAVVRAVDERLEIVELVPVYRGKRAAGLVRRGLDDAHHAPLGHVLGRDVVPALPVILGHVDQSIVGARPQQPALQR